MQKYYYIDSLNKINLFEGSKKMNTKSTKKMLDDLEKTREVSQPTDDNYKYDTSISCSELESLGYIDIKKRYIEIMISKYTYNPNTRKVLKDDRPIAVQAIKMENEEMHIVKDYVHKELIKLTGSYLPSTLSTSNNIAIS